MTISKEVKQICEIRFFCVRFSASVFLFLFGGGAISAILFWKGVI